MPMPAPALAVTTTDLPSSNAWPVTYWGALMPSPRGHSLRSGRSAPSIAPGGANDASDSLRKRRSCSRLARKAQLPFGDDVALHLVRAAVDRVRPAEQEQ